MAFYIDKHLDYICMFYQQEKIKNSSITISEIASTLRNNQLNGLIKIYIWFIKIYTQTLDFTFDFFQTETKPIFSLTETRLYQLG